MREYQNAVKKLKIRSNLLTGAALMLRIIIVVLVIANLFQFLALTSGYNPDGTFLLSVILRLMTFSLLIFLVVRIRRDLLDDTGAAEYLDRFNEDKTDTYQNPVELSRDERVDPEILDRIVRRADTRSRTQVIKPNTRGVIDLLLIFIMVILAQIVFLILAKSDYKETLNYYLLLKPPPEKHKEFVEIIPGDLDLVKNSDVVIEVIDPEPKVEHEFFYKRELKWRKEKMPTHRKKFPNLDFSFSYFVRTPYAVSDTFSINIFELPAVKKIRIAYDYPDYTGLADVSDETGNGSIKALRNTSITMNIEANNPIERADLIFSSGSLIEMERAGRSAFRAQFEVTENGSYHINLEDFLKNRSRKISRSISVIPDRMPEIEIVYPGRDTIMNQNMLLPLRIQASDDFGMEDLVLKYYVNDEAEDSLLIRDRVRGTVIDLDHDFDLTGAFLIPGDRVTYWTEISDNSPEHKTASSKRYIIRFPSIEEIYQEIEEEERANTDLLQRSLEKSQEMQQEFDEKRRELMRKEEVDWEDKKQLEDFLKRQENLNQEIENIADSYQELLEKFENNQALSQETLEKMEKIRDLMDEIATEDLKSAMEQLQKSLEDMDPEVLRKAMEDFQFSLEDFSEKLDQTIDLLQQIKKEQAMQKALEISEEMEEMQEKLNEKTQSGTESGEELAREQEAISEKLENLKEQLKKTEDLLDPEKDQEIQEKMEELREEMEKDGLESELDQSSQCLEQNDFQKARESQTSAASKMKKYTSRLSEMQQMMSAGSMAAIGEIIDETIRRMLIFSFEHERLLSMFGSDPYPILPGEIAIYEGINITLQKLYSVPMIVLVLGPKFVYDANFTNASFRELFQDINDAGRFRIRKNLENILKGINLMIYDLMQAGSDMQGGGGGMQSLMQAMQQMGQQQMLINMATQQLLQQMGEEGVLSRDMLAEARRLARDEQRLAENLKRLLQNDPEAQKQTSSLNQIIEDLESISRNLSMGRLDQELVDKQERILSRLLDAQKSIHKREFSRKRKSEISDIESWDLPEEIKLRFEELRRRALLDEDYKKYPKEYQELIQEYLRILNQKVEKNSN